jgi:hypothetical protein
MQPTVEIRTGAECPPHARDDTHPQARISVELLPDLGDFAAGGLVDAIELLGPVDGDLDDVFFRVGDFEVSKADGFSFPRHCGRHRPGGDEVETVGNWVLGGRQTDRSQRGLSDQFFSPIGVL